MAHEKAAAKDKGRGIVWAQGLACGACVAIAPAACGLLAVLLAPAIVALLLDRTPGRPVARGMLLCGAAACVGPVMTLWQVGGTSGALLSDPATFGSAWAACTGGWLLTQLLPIGLRGILEAASLARTATLRAERAKLVQAWGLNDQ